MDKEGGKEEGRVRKRDRDSEEERRGREKIWEKTQKNGSA